MDLCEFQARQGDTMRTCSKKKKKKERGKRVLVLEERLDTVINMV